MRPARCWRLALNELLLATERGRAIYSAVTSADDSPHEPVRQAILRRQDAVARDALVPAGELAAEQAVVGTQVPRGTWGGFFNEASDDLAFGLKRANPCHCL